MNSCSGAIVTSSLPSKNIYLHSSLNPIAFQNQPPRRQIPLSYFNMPPSQNLPVPSYLTMNFDFVTVRVGEQEFAVAFQVYRKIITAVSPYFHGVFSGFNEATDRTTSLEDVTEQTFRIFLQWMYAQLHTSGPSVLVPDLSFLGPSANQQNDGGQDDGEEDNDTGTSQSALLARRTQRGPLCKSFDEVGYQNVRSCEDAGEDMYFEDAQWKKNYLMAQTSSLNLFIFADKYSVHQLRDDIITALLGQANTWRWSPDPNQELITKAYDNLPETAKFHKFMVHCTAHCWLAEPGQDLTARMRSLVE
jgi:hypothetical protein